MNVYSLQWRWSVGPPTQNDALKNATEFLAKALTVSSKHRTLSDGITQFQIIFETNYELAIPATLPAEVVIFQVWDDRTASKTITGIEAGYPMKNDFVCFAGASLPSGDIEDEVVIDVSTAQDGSNIVYFGLSTNDSTDFYTPFTGLQGAVIPSKQFANVRQNVNIVETITSPPAAISQDRRSLR